MTEEQVVPSVEDPFRSVEEVAKMFSVKPAQVRSWIRDGKIKAHPILGKQRILQSEINRVANAEYGE